VPTLYVIATTPEPLVLPFDAPPELGPTLQLLFSEAFSEPGRQTAIDRKWMGVFAIVFLSFTAMHIDSH
jgi:hypothetical protein